MMLVFPDAKIHEATHLEQSVFDLIVAAIERTFENFPDEPLDLKEIALSTCTDIPSVKRICYFLTITNQMKASFFPIHKWCSERIGNNGTVHALEEAIDAGIFDGKCKHCGGIMNGKNFITIGMEFWKVGSKIK